MNEINMLAHCLQSFEIVLSSRKVVATHNESKFPLQIAQIERLTIDGTWKADTTCKQKRKNIRKRLRPQRSDV